MPLIAVEAKADRNGVIHLVHLRLVQPTHVLPQAALVDGPDLLQEDHRVFVRPTLFPAMLMWVGRRPYRSGW